MKFKTMILCSEGKGMTDFYDSPKVVHSSWTTLVVALKGHSLEVGGSRGKSL